MLEVIYAPKSTTSRTPDSRKKVSNIGIKTDSFLSDSDWAEKTTEEKELEAYGLRVEYGKLTNRLLEATKNNNQKQIQRIHNEQQKIIEKLNEL
jgi:hypothetical protein